MTKRVIIKNGRKYIVNCCGWEDGIGPGAPSGTLWMKSTDGNWYYVNVSGTSGSLLSVYVNPTPSSWQSPGQDFGYQLVQGSDGNVYQVYLSGSGVGAQIEISQTPWPIKSDYKPYFLLKSITDGNFYEVFITATSSSVSFTVDSTLITTDSTLITADNSGSISGSGNSFFIKNTYIPYQYINF